MQDNRVAVEYAAKLFSKITPALRYDGAESMESWQARAKQRLSALLGMDKMLPAAEDAFEVVKEFDIEGGHAVEFKFQSEPDYFVPCYLLLPHGYSGEKLPACICIQGHSTGMHNSLCINEDGTPLDAEKAAFIQGGDRDFAVRAVKEGYAAFCIEQRYMGRTGTFREGPGCAKGVHSMATVLLGRCAIGERVWDIMRLIDVIEKHFPKVDTQNLLCMGNSGGGTATFYAACMEERIRRAMPSCGFCTFQDSIVDLRHCACNYIPGIAYEFDMGDLAGLIAPRDLIIVHGAKDDIFPEFGVRKAFDQAKIMFDSFGGRLKLVTGEEGHRFYADQGWRAVRQLEDAKNR